MNHDRNDELLEIDGATAAFLSSLAETPDVSEALELAHVAAAAVEAATAPLEPAPAPKRTRVRRLMPRRATSMSLPAFASLILSAKGAAAASAVAIATTGGLGAADLLPSQAQAAFDAATGSGQVTEEVVDDTEGADETGNEGATGLDRADEVTPDEADKGLDTARKARANGEEKSAAGKQKAEENKARAQQNRDDADDAEVDGQAKGDAAREENAGSGGSDEGTQRREEGAEREDAARANAAEESDASAEGRAREDAAREDAAGRPEAGRANAPTSDDTDDTVTPEVDGSAIGDEAATQGRGRAPVRK